MLYDLKKTNNNKRKGIYYYTQSDMICDIVYMNKI